MELIKNILKPKTDFSAKVRYRMRYDKNPLFIMLQDKYKVREYAQSKGVNTAKLFYVTETPETIPFDSFPMVYLIKMNHGRKWNILGYHSKFYRFEDGKKLVKDDGLFLDMARAAKFEMSRDEVIGQCRKWMLKKYRSKEWAYKYIEPKIMVEEFQVPLDGKALYDYRMYTFHGKVRVISIGSAIYRKTRQNIFFDPQWNEFKLTVYKESVPSPVPEKPENLEELIRTAQRLGEDIDFVRIDLYNTQQGVVLGEMTIYPSAGSRYCPTLCPVFNQWLGDQWELKVTNTLYTISSDIFHFLTYYPRQFYRNYLR